MRVMFPQYREATRGWTSIHLLIALRRRMGTIPLMKIVDTSLSMQAEGKFGSKCGQQYGSRYADDKGGPAWSWR